jgi:murein DD-endopeptidase MepM/ murein hydrolase activator NlpD
VNWQADNYGYRFMTKAEYFEAGKQYFVFHPAADLNVLNDGTGTIQVLAAATGKVVGVDPSWGIVLEHDVAGVKFYTLYMHVLPLAKPPVINTTVQRGALIAYVGNVKTGSKDNYHLHFAVLSPLHPEPGKPSYWGLLGHDHHRGQRHLPGHRERHPLQRQCGLFQQPRGEDAVLQRPRSQRMEYVRARQRRERRLRGELSIRIDAAAPRYDRRGHVVCHGSVGRRL